MIDTGLKRRVKKLCSASIERSNLGSQHPEDFGEISTNFRESLREFLADIFGINAHPNEILKMEREIFGDTYTLTKKVNLQLWKSKNSIT